jgi:chemotaxis protein MotB
MPDPKALAPIIIRKKVIHGGHHGGAWKVAYADFVTAMMALFIVLWLLASSDQVKKAVASYFVDPMGKNKDLGSGLVGSGESMAFSKQDLEQLKKKLEESLRKKIPNFEKMKDQVSLSITGEGLRIELLESSNGVFFQSGNADPTLTAKETLTILGQELGTLPNHLLVEGHTDSNPFAGGEKGYSNWELSADRANAARKFLMQHGVRADQVRQVRGFADQNLRNKTAPTDASNRRVSVIVQYMEPEVLTKTLSAAKMAETAGQSAGAATTKEPVTGSKTDAKLGSVPSPKTTQEKTGGKAPMPAAPPPASGQPSGKSPALSGKPTPLGTVPAAAKH